MQCNIMKKIYLYLITSIVLLLAGCKTAQQPTIFGGGNVNVSTAKSMGPDTLTVIQIDSMVVADKLPAINKWNASRMKDHETGIQYIYSTLYDPTSKIIYTVKVLSDNELYVVMKRQIGTNK